MPKVRTHTEPTVAARPLRTPYQRLNPQGAFGESLAPALAITAGVVEKMQTEDDLAFTKERVNDYRAFSRKRMYGDDDAYLARAGRDAYDSRDTIRKELDDYRKESAKGMSPRQAKMFNEAVQGYYDRDQDGIAKHSQRQRIGWLNDQDGAVVAAAQEDGALYWNDNAEYGTQIRKTVAQLGARSGWSDERIENETEARLSAMHLSAIDNILESEPGLASAYFANNNDEILPSLRDNVQQKINEQVDTVWAQTVADGIRAGGGTLTSRLDASNDIEDPDRRKLVRGQVEHDWRMEKQAKQEAQIAAYDEALKAIVVGGMNPHQWRAHNFDQWERLSGGQQAALMKPPAATTTDPEYYYQMKGLMATDKDKAREYLAQYLHKFSNADAKKFIDQMFKTEAGEKPVMSDMAAFNDTAESVLGKEPSKGVNRKKWNEKRTTLYGMYQDQLDQYFANNPGADFVPNDERQKILDGFKVQSTREDAGFMYFDETMTFDQLLDEVPAQDVQDISDALREQGLPVTPHNIKEAYAAYLSRENR